MNKIYRLVLCTYVSAITCNQPSLNENFLQRQHDNRKAYTTLLTELRKEYEDKYKKATILPCLTDPSPATNPIDAPAATLHITSFNTSIPTLVQENSRDIKVCITTIFMDEHAIKHAAILIAKLPARTIKFIRNNIGKGTFPTIASKHPDFTIYRVSLKKLYDNGVVSEEILKTSNHQPLWILIKN